MNKVIGNLVNRNEECSRDLGLQLDIVRKRDGFITVPLGNSIGMLSNVISTVSAPRLQ